MCQKVWITRNSISELCWADVILSGRKWGVDQNEKTSG